MINRLARLKWRDYPRPWMDEKRRMPRKEIWNRSDYYATAGTATARERIESGFDVDPAGENETLNGRGYRVGKRVR